MNRNIVIGGVVAVAIILGVGAWYLLSGRSTSTTGSEVAGEPAGPITLNPVNVVTDHSASQSDDGRMLSVMFPKFELVAKGGETTSSVFSTTWRLKLAEGERATVATVSLQGFMKSAGTPPPAPAPAPQPSQPATPAAPAADGAAPAVADAATPPAGQPPAEQPAATPAPAATPTTPAAPAPAAAAKPVAGDGAARIVVTIGGETSITEWRDWTGAGSEHQLSKAVAYIGTPADVRNGAGVPVTVTVEVAGNTSTETLASLRSMVLRIYAEQAPIPVEPGNTPGTAAAPAEVTPPADAQPAADTPPAAPPAEGAPATTTP
jgi:hypothetical protein